MPHTPGPWRFEPHDGGQWFGNIVSYGLGKNELGIQTIRTIDCLRRGAPQEEMEATARLLAAAPDLLKSLTDLLFDIKRWNSKPISQEAINEARIAVAKATGARY
jgi:hypothetical protein